jgi:hypothetical protein
MKKKLIFMGGGGILLTILLAFSFISCEEDLGYDLGGPKSITVTGLSGTDYKFGVIGLGFDGDLVAMHYPNPISSGSFTAELLAMDKKSGELTSSSFKGEGNFTVVLLIYKATPYNKDNLVYEGGIDSKLIKDEVTTIPFSSFRATNSSSINIKLNQLLN